jgi:DNA-binding PadR family transcriptional regulator
MIDLAILGVLKDQELHGYELKKRISELLGARSSVSFGSLYPALARLERNGQVKAVEAQTDVVAAVPSSGSLKGELAAFRARHPLPTRGSRGKKVYGITERGDERLVELLTDLQPGTDDRTFAVRVAFCRFLPSGQRLELFARRRAELANRLADRRRRGEGRDGRIDLYLRSLRDHDDESMSHDLAWIDRLIEAERQAPLQEGT